MQDEAFRLHMPDFMVILWAKKEKERMQLAVRPDKHG
jgi:hypothetical protein